MAGRASLAMPSMADVDHLPLADRRRRLQHSAAGGKDSPLLVAAVTRRCSVDAAAGAKNTATESNLKEWPQLPRGAKFVPSNEDLLWHLFAKVGNGKAYPHPYIGLFIVSLHEKEEAKCMNPQDLSGIDRDGTVFYFFHKAQKSYGRKGIDEHWKQKGKSKELLADADMHGFKKTFVLHDSDKRGIWIRHEYHIGTITEENDGDFVLSKMFYKIRENGRPMSSTCDNRSNLHMNGEEKEPHANMAVGANQPFERQSFSVDTQANILLPPDISEVGRKCHVETMPAPLNVDSMMDGNRKAQVDGESVLFGASAFSGTAEPVLPVEIKLEPFCEDDLENHSEKDHEPLRNRPRKKHDDAPTEAEPLPRQSPSSEDARAGATASSMPSSAEGSIKASSSIVLDIMLTMKSEPMNGDTDCHCDNSKPEIAEQNLAVCNSDAANQQKQLVGDDVDRVSVTLDVRKRKRKRTATDSVRVAIEEDAPGLLEILLDKGVTVEEIKLYESSDDADLDSPTEDDFETLETVIAKFFLAKTPLHKFPAKHTSDRKAFYCLGCLVSLIEQARYLAFRGSPVEWGWCRDLRSFIFVFKMHNRLILERPEYGYATYFFEIIHALPIKWQIKRLVTAMKLTNCSRSTLIENKPLLVGVDLTEGEARVLEEFGWIPNTGLGTMLSYCDRVYHDRKHEMMASEWKAKIGNLLIAGYESGYTVLTTARCPEPSIKSEDPH